MIMDIGVAEFENNKKLVQLNFISTEGDYKVVYHMEPKMAEKVGELIIAAANQARQRIISGVTKPS